MATTIYVGNRRYFDTNAGRIIAGYVHIPFSSAELVSQTLDIRDAFFISALITVEHGELPACPITVGNSVIIDGTDVYLTRNSDYTLSMDTYAMTVSIMPEHLLQCYGLIILETTDSKWYPLMLPISVRDDSTTAVIIPAAASGFGNIDTYVGFQQTIGLPSSQGVIDNYIALGERLKGGEIDPSKYDPYEESVSPSQPAGGIPTGNMYASDDIDEPDDPEISAVSTGFISLWSPTEQQMLSLSAFMWNADFLTIDFWKKLIANPLDLIYGLNIVPLDLGPYIDGTGNVVVGLIDTHIQMNHLSTQWITVNCGSINIEEAWGAYLDYDPYTKLEIYLPFCGVHPLKVDDFMPGSINVTYKIDLVSGSCVALVKSTKSNKHNDTLNSIVYQFMGNCASQIPVTAAQYADAVRAGISIVAAVGSMVAGGVGGAAAVLGANKSSAERSIQAHTIGMEINKGASVVENVMNLKPSIERSGAIGASGSLLAVRAPYLIFTRPRMARPQNQNVYTGYPSFITRTLGELNGWTKVQAIHLDNIPCTSEEMAEIDTLLQTGVIM